MKVLDHRFRLSDLLGEGRIGQVYRARDLLESRDVAIKLPHSWHTRNPEFRARFRRELLTGMRLRHAGIVKSLETGEHDGTPFLVMELIEGEPLEQWFHQSGRDYEALAEVLEKLLDALHYAHTRRVVHQELKPANVLVDHEGQPKLLDFGLAGRLEDQLAVGPQPDDGLAYLSPEQAMGVRGDQRSDLYSLGAVLFHILSERPLTQADEPADYLLTHLNETAPSLSALRGDVPVWLERLVNRLLMRRPDQRPQSATEVLQLVRRRLQAGADAEMKRPGPSWGRESELTLMEESLTGLEEGRGNFIRLSGPPGVGKSLLVDELLYRASQRDYMTVRVESTADSVMHLGSIARSFEDPELPIFERILESALAMPVVLVLEGIHQAHRSVGELLGELLGACEDVPLLVVVTDRPAELDSEELEEVLASVENHVELGGLDWEGTAQLIEEHTWTAPPRSATAWFQKTTEGNPLFVKLLAEHLEGSHLNTAGAETQWSSPAPGTFPDTLEALLKRKLEKQGPEREALLGLAGCLGERFSFNALKAVTYYEEHELEALLEQMVRQGLLREEWVGGLLRHRFTNTMLWDLAAQTIPPRRQRRLHLLAARFYEKSGIWPASILAYHYRLADRWEKSLRYTAEAMEEALEREDRGEATFHYAHLVEGLRELPVDWPGPNLSRYRINQLPRPQRLRTLVTWTLLVTGAVEEAAPRVLLEDTLEQALMSVELFLWGASGSSEPESRLQEAALEASKPADQARLERALEALQGKAGRGEPATL